MAIERKEGAPKEVHNGKHTSSVMITMCFAEMERCSKRYTSSVTITAIRGLATSVALSAKA
jgi:hypothetical protein